MTDRSAFGDQRDGRRGRRGLRRTIAAISTACLLGGAAVGAGYAAPAEAATLRCSHTTTPDAAARCLYKAWRAKSTKAAKKVAGSDAIADLFAAHSTRMYFGGCTQVEVTAWQCDFNAAGKVLTMDVVTYGGRTLVDAVSWGSAG